MKIYTGLASKSLYQGRSNMICYCNPTPEEVKLLIGEALTEKSYFKILDGRTKDHTERDNNIVVACGFRMIHSYMRGLGSQKFGADWGIHAVDYGFQYADGSMGSRPGWFMIGPMNLVEDPDGIMPIAEADKIEKAYSQRMRYFMEDIKTIATPLFKIALADKPSIGVGVIPSIQEANLGLGVKPKKTLPFKPSLKATLKFPRN